MLLIQIKTQIVAILLIFFSICSASGQNDTYEESIENIEYYDDSDTYDFEPNKRIYFTDLNLMASIPQFDNKFDHLPFGIDFNILYQIKKTSSIFLVTGMKWMTYGSRSYTYDDYDPYDGYLYQFSQNFNNNFFSFNLGARYFAPKNIWVFNPYVEVDFRYNYYYALYSVKNDETSETIDMKFKGGNGGLGYGICIGSLINIKSPNYFPNFSMTYHSGNSLELYYIDDENEFLFNVSDYYDQKFFPISFLEIKLGVIVKF